MIIRPASDNANRTGLEQWTSTAEEKYKLQEIMRGSIKHGFEMFNLQLKIRIIFMITQPASDNAHGTESES
jgi:hypothetical protein